MTVIAPVFPAQSSTDEDVFRVPTMLVGLRTVGVPGGRIMRKSPYHQSRRASVRLGVEPLEERAVPANLYYIAPNPALDVGYQLSWAVRNAQAMGFDGVAVQNGNY